MTAHPEVSRDPIIGVQIRIGVMGSAGEPADPIIAALCHEGVTVVSVARVPLGLPAWALALGLLLLMRSKAVLTESTPGVGEEGQGPAPTGRATESAPPTSVQARAAAVKRAA